MDQTNIKKHSALIFAADLLILLMLAIVAGEMNDVIIYFFLLSVPIVILVGGLGIAIYRKHLAKFQKGWFVWFSVFSAIYLFVGLLTFPTGGVEAASWVVFILVFIGVPVNFLIAIVLLIVGELLTRRSKSGPPPASAAP